MKHYKVRGVFCILAWVLALTIAAAPVLAEGVADLAVTKISVDKEPVRAGEALVPTITYKNQGSEPVPAGTSFEIRVSLVSADGTEQACSATVKGSTDLAPGAEKSLALEECQIIPLLPGSYSLSASLNDRPMAQAQTLTVEETESALPENLSRLFAGLGMFIAMMAIMAVGAEVVIDSFKVSVGMKRKVTSLEALEKMEKMLPGQLAALGAGAASQAQLRNLIADLEKTLEPVHNIREAAVKIRAGQFGEAYDLIVGLIPEGGTVLPDQLDLLKTDAKQALEKGLDQLQADLNLGQELMDGIKAAIGEQIDSVTVASSLHFLEEVFETLQSQKHLMVDEWLREQREMLLSKGRSAVLDLFDEQVRPALEGLGFQPDAIAQARQEVEVTLKVVDTKAMAASDTFIDSVQNLLQAVEDRRFDMQSPMRKIWRRLRRTEHSELWLAIALGIVGLIAGLIVVALVPMPVLLVALTPIGAGLIVFVLTWLLIKGLAALGYRVYNASSKDKNTWSDLYWVEILWNSMITEQAKDPDQFDKPPRAPTLTVETLAQKVLQNSDVQRDQENSRLRWLRVLSLCVAVVMAYLLQVDAARLLDAAVPGIANTINVFKIEVMGRVVTPGIVLTALAASAGSAFWHDQLDRLQMVKKQAESAAQVVQQIKGMVEEQ